MEPITTTEAQPQFIISNQDAAASSTEGQPVPDAPLAVDSSGVKPESDLSTLGAVPAPEPEENAAASTREWEPAPLPEHMKPEDAYGFGKYHQSRYDSAQQELAQLRAEMQQLEQLNPVSRAVMQDPDLLEVVARKLRGNDGEAPQASAPPAAVELPPAPTPPSDLYSDEGEKYFRDLAAYQSQVTQAQAQKLAVMEQQLSQFQQFQQQQGQHAQVAQAVQEAQYQYGLSRADAEAFVNDLVSGTTDDVETRLLGWKARRRMTADDVRKASALENAQQRQQQRTPATASSVGGGTPPAPAQDGLIKAAPPLLDPFAT